MCAVLCVKIGERGSRMWKLEDEQRKGIKWEKKKAREGVGEKEK